MATTTFEWDAGRLSASFAADASTPVHLTSVIVGGRTIAFDDSTPLASPIVRQLITPQPLVEVFLDRLGHDRSGERRIRSAIGSALRYVTHDIRAGAIRILQADPVTGLRVTLILEASPTSSSWRSSVEVHNEGSEAVTLAGVSSAVIAPDGTGEAFSPGSTRVSWAISEWLGENRWNDEAIRDRILPDLGLTLHGQDPRGAFTLSSVGSWSTGEYLPMGVLADSASGAAIAWQVESAGGWTWEIGERREGLYLLAQGPDDLAQQWRRRLGVGESFSTVPAAIAFSFGGRDGALAELTEHRRAFRRDHPDFTTLPVIYNDYMNTLDGKPTTEALLPLIAAAAAVGSEIFVIDAGWYDDDDVWWNTVGEWEVAPTRFTNGFGEVFDAIHASGMRSGLWLEPEIVGVHSPIARTLPAAAFLQRSGQPVVEHHRLHLDLRHPAAIAHLDATIDRLVEQFGISYFKMDYNISARAGTDRDATSAGDGMLAVARAHRAWVEGVLDRHPGLTLENCSSGAMRADYALLSVFQLQSTSDQQNWALYPPIAASSFASIAPEQAASWAYPQPEMTDEQIAFTIVTGLAGRLYLSGFLDRMSPRQRALVRDGIDAFRTLRPALAASRPFWPSGLPQWTDTSVSVGLSTPDGSALLFVWDRAGHGGPIQLDLPDWVDGAEVSTVYPAALPEWRTSVEGAGLLTVYPQDGTVGARVFRVGGRTPQTA